MPTKQSIPATWPAPVAGLLALTLYARCLAPGLTWAHDGADGGDLLAAALIGGVPHPPGYPTYQLLLRGILAVWPGDPARAGNWLSAVCAALAVALLADLLRRSLPARPERPWLALAGASLWATAPALWGQAVITEVYTLNALIVMACWWLLWRWRATGEMRWVSAAAFAGGLGLGNHLTLALIVPGALVLAAGGRRNVSQSAGLRGRAGRTQSGGLRYRTIFKAALPILAAGLLGLSVYVYLPLAAGRNPSINWGDPRTPERLAWVVSAQVYRPLVFGLPLAELPGRLAETAGDALQQLGGGPWGLLLAGLGMWRLTRRDPAWAWATGLTALAYAAYAVGYAAPDAAAYAIPAWAMAAIWAAEGLAYLASRCSPSLRLKPQADTPNPLQAGYAGRQNSALKRTWLYQTPNSFGGPATARLGGIAARLVLVTALLLPILAVAGAWHPMDLSADREARDFVAAALAADENAVILTAGDAHTFALWYAIFGLGRRPDITPINVHLYGTGWYQHALGAARPWLVPPDGRPWPPLKEFVAAASAARPIYRTEPLPDAFDDFEPYDEGPLVRLRRR